MGTFRTLTCLVIMAASALADVVEDEVAVRDVYTAVPYNVLTQNRRLATRRGFAAVAGLSLFGGHDSNVHRSPDTLEQGSGLWGGWVYVRGYAVFPDRSRLLSTFQLRRSRFPDQSAVDDGYGKLSIWYERDIVGDLNLELDVDASAANDHATRITGAEYLRDYSYRRLAFEGLLVLRPGSRHRLKAGPEYIRKNYGEVSTLNSLDWEEISLQLRYRFRFGPYQYLRIRLSTALRTYDEELTSDTLGREQPYYPTEQHRYSDIEASYARTVKGRYEYRAGAALRWKHDRFQDYESYTSTSLTAGGAFWPVRTLELRADLFWFDRDYDVLPGDGGEQLQYNRLEVGLSGRLRIQRALWLFAALKTYDRDSNLSSGLEYRSYRGIVYALGLSYFVGSPAP